MNLVYLAGPITGLTYGECTDWREYAVRSLADAGIKAVSPMRGKEYLQREQGLMSADGNKYSAYGALSTNRGIMTRDHFDTQRCDVLLVNLLGAKQVSIGTVMEISFAHTRQIPIICAMEQQDNPHEHGMILEAIGFRVPMLDDALQLVKAILL